MYNPVNMKIEDEDRLKQKDQREKDKKKRYEIRFVAEKQTRKETLAEQDRLDQMRLRRTSFKRVEEEANRGFDIITNGDPTTALKSFGKTEYMKLPNQTWTKINDVNGIPNAPGLVQ